MPVWLNLPNLLTGVRLLLTPFVVVAILEHRYERALVLFFAAGFSDGLDGFLARRYGWITRLGTYLDPVADKALLVSVYLALGAAGALPQWLVALVVGRDILILLLAGVGFVFLKEREFPPALWGKVSTVIQIATAFLATAHFAYPGLGLAGALEAFTALAGVGTTWSGLYYLWRAGRVFQASGRRVSR